ncbi:hypothetical protein THIOKS1850021 [Thiocapsa sp. KS1]|nr:hypothetical protein THIOKS1850021 [Thiocapsa sp. KS1]
MRVAMVWQEAKICGVLGRAASPRERFQVSYGYLLIPFFGVVDAGGRIRRTAGRWQRRTR